MKLTKYISGAFAALLLSAGIGSAAQLNFYNDAATQTTLRFTLECSLGCLAWDGGGFSAPDGDLFALANNSEALEIATVNSLTGESYTSLTKTNGGGSESADFTTSAEYILIKIGQSPDVAVVQSFGENNEFKFRATKGTGSGLSHWSAFGENECDPAVQLCGPPVNQVPVPASLPLMMGALGIVGIVARRRRKAAS